MMRHDDMAYVFIQIIFAGLHLMILGLYCLPLLLGGLLVASILRPRTGKAFARRKSHVLLFCGCVLIAAEFVNLIWSLVIAENLYSRADDTWGMDFYPFFPITYRYINDFGPGTGHLYGVTLLQLQAIWLVFALCNWALAIFLYRAVSRRLFRRRAGV